MEELVPFLVDNLPYVILFGLFISLVFAEVLYQDFYGED